MYTMLQILGNKVDMYIVNVKSCGFIMFDMYDNAGNSKSQPGHAHMVETINVVGQLLSLTHIHVHTLLHL